MKTWRRHVRWIVAVGVLVVAIGAINGRLLQSVSGQDDGDDAIYLPLLGGPAITPTATATATPIATPIATPSPSPSPTPMSTPSITPPALTEWNQHAHDAQRTSFNQGAVPTPWRWKWVWNGADATGGIAAGKFKLPRNSQPVTGGGRVYIAAGSRGVFALDNATGAPLWNRNPGGSLNSTPAYDAATEAIFVVSSDGALYKLSAATGDTLLVFPTAASSTLPLPPAIVGDRIFFAMGNHLYAVDNATLQQRWRYDAGAPVDTPPAYSATRDVVVAASRDLYIHAIRNGDGSQAWRTKTAVQEPGDPDTSADNNLAEVSRGWPVIAEQSGIVLVKLRLDWQSLWRWSPWPGTNAAMQANLAGDPEEQALLALDLDTGETAFLPNIGHGGFGDGNYMPMGPQPVVKRFDDGSEVAYTVMRGSPCLANPCDGRWDSRLGELMLSDSTVAGYSAGHVRFMENTFFPTDEQANVAMAGDQLFAGHWEAGIAHRIVDRSAGRGSGGSPIITEELPHIATSQDTDICGGGFDAGHFCAAGLSNTRTWPGGFYIYWEQEAVYDQFWSEYATWVVSGATIYYVSTNGAVVALENGQPEARMAGKSPTARAASRPASPSPHVIDFSAAREYAGQTVTVAGTLRQVFNNGKAVYLGYHVPHRGHFLVRILKRDWANFGQTPETRYSPGQQLLVTGRIEWYQGDPVINVREPQQIQSQSPP